MIFTTKNKELAIFGNTVTDFKEKWKEFKKELAKNNGKLVGENGAIASLFSGKKSNNILTPEVLSQFDDFKEKFNSSSLSAEALAEQMKNVDQRIIDYAKTCKNGQMTTEGFKTSVEGMTFSAKAATVATKALSVALNTVAFFAITEIIGAVVTKLHDLANASDIARENAAGLAKSMSSFNENISGNSSKISDLNSRYQELSKGVNNLGENISLSSSEYDEYKDIISQVSDIMPDLTTYFNAQGEAIGFTSGKINDLNKEYQKYIQQQEKEFFMHGNEEGQTVQDMVDAINADTSYGNVAEYMASDFKWPWEDYDVKDIPAKQIIAQLEKMKSMTKKEIADYLNSGIYDDVIQSGGSQDSANLMQGVVKKIFGFSRWDLDGLRIDEDEIKDASQIISSTIEDLQNKVEANISNGREALRSAIRGKDDFWDDKKLSDKQRDNIIAIISGIDSKTWKELELDSPQKISSFGQKLIDSFSDKSFSNAFDKLFSQDLDKLPVEKYVSKVRQCIDVIGDKLNLSEDGKNNFLISLGFDNLDELVNDYNGAIKSATEKWKLDGVQKEDLEKFFEENSINTEEEIDTWKEIAAEAENAAEAKQKYLAINAVDKTAQQLETLKETYKSASEDISTLTTALSESVSGTGLSPDSVDAVTSMFSDLKGYDEDKLLDKTANGLRLNTRELEKLKKEYDDNTAKEFYQNVEDAYNSWQDALRNGEEKSVTDELYDQYQQAAQLADQYVGLTSAYNKWQDALSTANEGDMYDSMQGQIKAMEKLWVEGRTNVDEFRAFADLISYKDLSGASQAEVEKAYSNSIGRIKRYFTEDEKGLENFLKDVQKVNSEWAHMNKDGSWDFDFGVGGDKKVAKALEMDVEAVQIILRKMSEYSDKIDIDFDFDSVAMMGKEADKACDKLKKLGKIGKNMKFKFDTGDISRVNTQIEDAESVLNKFRDKDGNVDVNIKGAKEAQTILAKLLTEKQEIEKPAILKVDTSQLSGKAVGVITMLQRIQQEINTYDVQVKVGADTTETEKKIKKDIKAIKTSYGEELSDININLDSISSAKQELKNLGEDDIEVIVNAIVNHKKVDDYKKEKEKKTIEVETDLNDTAVNEFMKKPLEKTIKAKVEVDSSELDKADAKKPKESKKKEAKNATKKDSSHSRSSSKAFASGTFDLLKENLAAQGFANASGNISIPKDQTALVNELGEELIVRDGKWFTVKGGAQFKELKKGDIVFNHMQTRQLLKNGKITSSNNRGKFAHSKGTFGNAYSHGSNITFNTHKDNSTKKDSKKSSKSKKSNRKDSDKKKDSKQLIDWIERKLDVLQDKIDLTKAKFENLFSVKRKENNLNAQIKQTTKLLDNEQKAIAKYQKKADSIKLSGSLKKKVKNGAIKGSLSELIKEYGEKTANQISKYQDYIDKVKDAKKAVAGLKAEIKDLSRQKLDLKIEDNERKRTYQEAKYANATTAKQKHKILNKEINTYKSDDKAYADYYKEAEKQRKKDGNAAKTAVTKTKGISKSDKNKIKKLIKQGKEIPSALMKKVKKHSMPTYQKLVEYNNSVDFVADALRDKKLANEQNETNMREKRIERAQNYADEAEAKYNLNQQYEENAVSAKDKNKYEAESMKYLDKQYGKLMKVAELEGDVTEQKRLQAEKQEKINESYKKMYDNIKTEYENKTGLNDARIATVQSQIATLEAAGKSSSKAMYETMMGINNDTKERLLQERAELLDAGKDFEYGSEEWYAWQNDLLAIDQQMESCAQQTIEWQKKLNEFDFRKFSLFADQLDATKSHLGFLVDMLSHEDLTSKESGGLTDAGFATISLRFSSIENYKKAIGNAQEELAKLYEQHLDGSDFLTEEEFLAKREEQLDIIRESTEAIADEKDAIIGLVEDAMQLQIDSINELIEKKKKALATEKDLYEYQRKVAKQTKNIALIEKQIAALSGDQSEEARARIQKLQVNLEEAREDLKDTEYDRWHDDQNEMLDNLADEVEDFWERIINDLKKNIDGSLDNIMQMITDNPDAVARALDELGLGDALSIITAYNPDGTHVDKAIDYGGNSYESTYNGDGENTANNFKTDPGKKTEGSREDDGSFEKAQDDLKRITEEAARISDEAAKRIAEEAARKAQEEKDAKAQAQRRKDDAMNAAYARADSIMQQSAGGAKNFVIDKVPMEGVKAVVEEFLNSSALHKPTTDAGKKRMKTDPLLKYIAENYKGKTLSNANEARLGAFLGIPVKDKNNVTTSEANKILKAFKNAGFAKGGIAQFDSGILKKTGEDGLVLARNGEAFVRPEDVQYIKALLESVPTVNTAMDAVTRMADYKVVNTAVQPQVSVGDINVHMDGAGVIDPKSFCETFRRSNEMQRAIQDATINQIGKPYCNTLF